MSNNLSWNPFYKIFQVAKPSLCLLQNLKYFLTYLSRDEQITSKYLWPDHLISFKLNIDSTRSSYSSSNEMNFPFRSYRVILIAKPSPFLASYFEFFVLQKRQKSKLTIYMRIIQSIKFICLHQYSNCLNSSPWIQKIINYCVKYGLPK